MIRAIGLVVPVHDEEALVGECLRSVAAARAELPGGIHSQVVVVLDDCSDGSAAIVRRSLDERDVLSVSYRNVGRARARGLAVALMRFDGIPLHEMWLATTDADSRVPRDWLVEQLRFAEAGADAVAGVVQVDDWGAYPLERARAYEEFYRAGGDDAHDHVHGANLGVRASAYVSAGGFAPLVTGEDHALWNAVRARGHRSVSTRRIAVTTSARLTGRAPLGFASFLEQFPA